MAKTYYVLDGPRQKVIHKGTYTDCMEFVKKNDLNFELGLSGPMDENNKNKILTLRKNSV